MVFIIGWGLAYGPGGNLFCGASQFFCWQLEYDQYPTWLFQVTNDVGGEHDIVYIYIMMTQLAKIIELIMMATLLNATYAMQSWSKAVCIKNLGNDLETRGRFPGF